MATDEQRRWREISRYLDEVLELDEPMRERRLHELETREPALAQAVRSLLAERQEIESQPLLRDELRAAMPRMGLAGQQIGPYTLETVIGHGGMGTVWLARRSDGRYEGKAAIKLLNAALLGRPTEQRFVREGSVLAKLRHPNIARLSDAGVAPSGQPYLVLEYVEGEHIDRYAERHNLGIEARVRLFLDVLAAVAHAHSHLVVHRDLKPSNILVTADGTVKLLDFGVAALLGSDDPQLTREVDAGLTPEFAAPEQLLKRPVTTSTDVYALGVVLFVLLTGKHPYRRDEQSLVDLARATLEQDPPRPSQLATDAILERRLRGDLDNIISKALKKDAQERYQTADAVAQDLRAFLECRPVAARPDSFTYRAGKFIRRRRGGVAVSVLTGLALVSATAITTVQMIDARKQRDEALYQSKRAEFQARFAYLIMSEVGGDGGPITIRELLERGMEVLERNYGDDPRFVVGMLVNISGRYMNLGDTQGEHAALVRAERIARRHGDPDLIAKVQCNTVETELNAGRPEQARERMRDALANLAKLATVSFQRESECGAAQARMLWAEGKLAEATQIAARIAHQLEQQQQTDDLLYRTLTTMLDVLLSHQGRRAEARLWNEKLIAELKRSGEHSGMSMNNALHNQASHLYFAGEVRAALDLQRSFVQRLVAQEGVDGIPAAFALRLGLYAVHAQETDAGLRWLDQAIANAIAMEELNAQIGAHIARAQANLLLRRHDAARADIDAIHRLAERDPEDSRHALRVARYLQSQWLLARNDARGAVREIDSVLREVGYPQNRVADRLALMLACKARGQLALGEHAAALVTARDAVVIAEQNTPFPQRSAIVGESLMVLAHAQRATGDANGARRSAQRAAQAFASALGPQHSQTVAAVAF